VGIEGIGFDASFLLESIPLGFPTDRERVEGGRLDFKDIYVEKELIYY
jgi:hypothetical protein